jgi:hypothetical protein
VAGEQTVVAPRSGSGGQTVLIPSHIAFPSHDVVANAHTVVAGCTASAGHVVDVPLHVSA